MASNSTEVSTPETLGLVSVILLNWNGGKSTELAVQSVIEQTYTNIQLVLVDNCSGDGSLQAAEQLLACQNKIAHITVRNQSNLGFAKGMNSGIEMASGEYIMPMGQDVFLDPEYTAYVVKTFQSNPVIGAIGGIEWEWPNSEALRFEAKVARKNQGPHFLNKYFRSIKESAGDEPVRCFGVTGSFPIIRGSALRDVFERPADRYDEMFVTGYEDMDLWFRLNLCGWLVIFTPKTGAWHVGSGSVGGKQGMFEKDLEYQKRIFRNRYYILTKNCSLKILLRYSPHLCFFELMLPLYLVIFQRASIRSYWRAVKEVFVERRLMLLKRRRIQSQAKISFEELRTLFK